MNRCLLPSKSVVFVWTQPRQRQSVPSNRSITLQASSKGDGEKPTENGAKLPKEIKINHEKKIPIPKEVKAIEEKKIILPQTIPKVPTERISAKHFINTQKFVVPSWLEHPFREEWKMRKDLMDASDGFVTLNITPGGILNDGMQQFIVASEWKSIPEWESYSCSKDARSSHLPPGIYQYVPRRGEGFPEDFVPFLDYKEAVNAKYK